MTQQLIVTTPANTGTGDSPKAAFDKINANFSSLYNQIGGSLAGTITNYGAVSGVGDAGAAITAAAAANSLVIIPAGNWTIAAIPTVAPNVTIETLPGAVFSGVGAAALGFTTLDIDAFSLTPHALQQLSGGVALSLAGSIQAGLGFGSLAAGVSTWGPQFHANFNVVQTSIPYNPTEWQIYSNAAQGIATVTIGTNNVTRVSGTPFDSAWVGLPYFYFNGTGYKVLAVTDSSHLTVQTTSGGTVSWGATATNTFYFVNTSTTSTVNVNGTAVTFVAGQPFAQTNAAALLFINGTQYNFTYNSQTSLTLGTSAGVLTNATAVMHGNIANQLTNLTLQGLAGNDEELFVITETPYCALIQTAYAGNGSYRPMCHQTGEDGVGVGQILLGLYPGLTRGTPGHVTIGGGPGPVTQNLFNQAVQVESNPNNVNYLDLNGGATGTSPAIRAQGTDSSVGMGIDLHGAATLTLSSDFALTHGQWFFVANATSWPSLASSNGGPVILAANGSPAAIDIELAPKGTGAVWLGTYTAGVQTSTGYMTVKDSAGTTRRLLCL